MFLLAGLGNIGKQYENTRHNAGFMALDAVIAHYQLQSAGTKFHADCFKGNIAGEAVFALKPQTLMNRSGISVGAAAAFFKIPTEKIIVLYDDLDLSLAKLRIKRGGSNGGHNGLKDIDRVLGSDYWRIRLGIDRPAYKSQVTSYVLGAFTAEEQEMITPFYQAIAKHLPLLLHGEAEKMMTAVAKDAPITKSIS